VRKASVSDITVCILDRPRHTKLMAEVREAGARIRLISDGDVAGAISACRPDSGTDMLAGIGGTPEGIITAAAIRCMGGEIQATLAPKDDEERQGTGYGTLESQEKEQGVRRGKEDEAGQEGTTSAEDHRVGPVRQRHRHRRTPQRTIACGRSAGDWRAWRFPA